MAEAKKATDWERIEADYRAGLLSVREIAATHGISHTAINKRAKAEGWDRDLSAKIKAKAEALVSKREVSAQVSTERAETDRAIIEANAEVIANVRLAHRKDIGRARTLAMNLLAELEAQTTDRELFAKVAELLSGGSDDDQIALPDKMMDLYRAVTSLPGRTKTMKDLGDTLHKLITLEREAYNIADPKKVEVTLPPSAAMPTDPIEAAKAYQELMAGNS
ncbi:hypothetical protein SAMN04487785_1137 [Dyella jiangningensis]|uniref:hypothetical protein n=1 Tax=Dyella sp. AtDHG13 TaxID=1938897 RepID=UPI00087F16B6|nr:hypothetical protein [Dyella sp. AtDHG13]PXV60899.1 hypothetical protein BDW41_102630 [Dyella sp. AtDHG13]SDK93922.1 hypothetical protein SAMN04487785_1137 [Dyella jiangningensis]